MILITRICAIGIVIALWLATPARALDHNQIAVVINVWDPVSVQVGEYYAAQRRILFQNIIKVGFSPKKPVMTAKEFDALRAWVLEKTLPGVEAYVLTWTTPFKVECMSMTAAFAFGFDRAFCAEGCKPTKPSPYFNSPSRSPFSDHGMRPTMMLAGKTFANVKALIDRGVESDGSMPGGTAYLLSTSDTARNVRSTAYPLIEKTFKGRLVTRRLQQDTLTNAQDVLFYFTGLAHVDGLDTLRFVPGAIADHLTSWGGVVPESSQMSALRWIEAGATASYGTVEEPCNFPQKFPSPLVTIGRYLAGETLLEAYWKSVMMPGQGLFIGEPLAAPFARGTALPATTITIPAEHPVAGSGAPARAE